MSGLMNDENLAIAPNAAELSTLQVLWENSGDMRPMRLAEIHRRVCEIRRTNGEHEPAATTISTHLRSLLSKDLIEECGPKTNHPTKRRSLLSVATRSPNTSYIVKVTPKAAMWSTFQALVAAYPCDQRMDAVSDFCEAAGVGTDVVQEIRKLLVK